MININTHTRENMLEVSSLRELLDEAKTNKHISYIYAD